MRYLLCLLALAGLGLSVPAPARAVTYETCTKAEQAEIAAAASGAMEMAQAAAAAVRDDDTFARWFGRYSDRNAETVRRNLKAVHDAISLDEINVRCINEGFEGCKDGTYAYVFREEHYHVHLCPSFRLLPAMFDFDAADPRMENGTREGTIIHELSHFVVIAGTDDHCYARGPCSDMARRDPFSAIRNADSYQYFAEDVGFFPVMHLVLSPTGRARR
ncbi:M35 family metallo-endopeptidase [Wenxinia saemankumensis]|uniref:Lysine-specific metallo-endopeptidase n=1 Tax=Wenxinia saemankumensis TaxID=1447782 RepID=A0A1M6HFU4_9RHOB|nr:M35 family metallo-endopeptidase [Wenxinia saemankumensis]SHJ21078.1 Lysine-specific metallo-endopeptidase [Wenxinia saemankumensis]